MNWIVIVEVGVYDLLYPMPLDLILQFRLRCLMGVRNGLIYSDVLFMELIRLFDFQNRSLHQPS